MSTLSTRQQHYEEIRKLLSYLSVEEQLRLISEISIKLHKTISTQPPEKKTPIAQAGTVRGKYAYVPTSSDRFAQRKQEEIEMEG
ncbi:hypothetical protein L0337_27330 [candidate division KSB1 bacterium]|nr:hypothetical protein [candidate division KSB1 bacterium]